MELSKRAQKYFMVGICVCFLFLIFVMIPSWRRYLLIVAGVAALALGLLFLSYKRNIILGIKPEQQSIVVEEGKVLCYLCRNQVVIEEWDSGEHRIGCAVRHFEKLSRMPEYPEKKCPKCLRRLRFWPGEEEMFYCDSNRLCARSGGSAICNRYLQLSETVRLNCFQCNVNYCINCSRPTTNSVTIEPTAPVTWVPSAPPSGPDQDGIAPPSYDEAVQ